MTVASQEELLVEFQKKTQGNKRMKRAKGLAASVGLIWEYLFKTPGEQRPYTDFAEMLGVRNAAPRLNVLVSHGLITKTSSRKGMGGGVGFICEWLEDKRRPSGAPGLDEKPKAKRGGKTWRNVKLGLRDLDAEAEHMISLLQSHDSREELVVIGMLREIQARVSKAIVVLLE